MSNKSINAEVIVKFFNNSLDKSNNALITRTLKKIGVIDRNYCKEMPSDGELWKVKILREICEKQSKGCFVLEPTEKIDSNSVFKLLPGMYEEEVLDKVLYIYPKNVKSNWIIPLDMKRKMSFRAIIVKLN